MSKLRYFCSLLSFTGLILTSNSIYALSFPLFVKNNTGDKCAVNLVNGKIVSAKQTVSGSVINPVIDAGHIGRISIQLEGMRVGTIAFQYDVVDAKTHEFYGTIKGGYDANGLYVIPTENQKINFSAQNSYIVSCASHGKIASEIKPD